MTEVRLLALCLLSSCSLIPGQAHIPSGGSAPSPSEHASVKSEAAPEVKPDDDDPPHVTAALKRLDTMQKLIDAKDFQHYAHESRDFQGTILFEHGWEGEKKHDAMFARLNALDTAAFKAFGGRLAKVGDGTRVTKLDADAVEAASAMIDACQQAAKTTTTGRGEASAALDKAIAQYDKAMAKAIKMDPMTMRYYGRAGGGDIDVPTELMECELSLTGASAEFGDEYKPEVAEKTEEETGCGVVDWLAEGVSLGGGQFAPYSRTQGGVSYAEKIACKKIPAHGNAPKAFRDATSDFAEYMEIPANKLVVVLDGKPYMETNDEDLHVYRLQKLRAYSKLMKFTKNPCGGDKVFCEAGGSKTAEKFNRLEFALERADAHAGSDPDRCKAQLKDAKREADAFEQFHADAVKSGDWIAGATYKTKKGAKMSEKEIIAAFEDKGKLADDRLTERYCAKKPK
jgi:hypothetical protein